MTKLIIAIVLTLTSTFANAQLKGSGKTITKTYNYKNFDKVYFENLDGKIEVEIGKPWSISVTIDDNLEPLLTFTENKSENELKIQFKGNKNNQMYIENTNFKIKITMPEASVIKNTGNSDLVVKNVFGRYFRLENTGNGDSKIFGTIDSLDINKTGNGDVNSENLLAKKATLNSTGNGDLIANVSEELSAKLTGNGDIINKGKAKFDAKSKKSGNGDLITNE
jgi:Putative auto-transporter adhesin, head GIN domain